MIDTAEFKNGLNISVDNAFFTIIWFQHHKPGKGGAMVRVKMRDIKTGTIIERTFKSGEKFKEVNLNRSKKQFLYKDGNAYHFMDLETYEQIELYKDIVGDNEFFLKENMEVFVLWLDEIIIGLELPNSVELSVKYTEPGIKGDTVSSTMKPAQLETGIQVKVPLFVNIGDVIRVDTRTGEYIERA